MEENEVRTNGSTAPETKAVSSSELWEKVLAARGTPSVEQQTTSQPMPAEEVVDLGSVSGSKLTEGVAPIKATSLQINALEEEAKPIAAPGGASAMPPSTFQDRAKALDPAEFPHPPKGIGQPVMPTLENFQHMVKGYGVEVSYDVVKKRLVILIPGHEGTVDNHESVMLAVINSLATLNGMSIGQIPAMLIALGDRKLRNRVADWIMSKAWDGSDRLQKFCETIQERKGYPPSLKKILLRRWLLSAVAAVLKAHGFRCRGVLVLQGGQGLGKTAFISALVPDEALRDLVVLLGHHLDGASKDSMTTAITHWIVELGELDGTLKKDIARLKSFITADADKVRRPYGRADSEYQRRTVFCATVNANNFLVDETGNSRWWTIAVESINYEHDIDMQQLFAQMAVEFQAGEQWWLTKDEELELAEVNKSHRVVSMVRERVTEAINLDAPANAKTKALSAIKMLQEAGIEYPSNPQCKECASILREIYGEPKKVQGTYVWRVALADRGQFRFDSSATSEPIDDDDKY